MWVIYVSYGTRGFVYLYILIRPRLAKHYQTYCAGVEQLNAHNRTQDMEVAVLLGFPDLTLQS